jgi:hypothetical protein
MLHSTMKNGLQQALHAIGNHDKCNFNGITTIVPVYNFFSKNTWVQCDRSSMAYSARIYGQRQPARDGNREHLMVDQEALPQP